MPATQHAASVWIIPILNRKMATAAATDSANTQTSTLEKTGASKERGWLSNVDAGWCNGPATRP